MTDGIVGRTLYRSILRWARIAQGIPLPIRPIDVYTVLPSVEHEFARPSALTGSDRQLLVCDEVRRLAKESFSRRKLSQGDEAELGLDRGFQALRLLNCEYTPKLEGLQQQRATHIDKHGVLCAVGQVFRHKKYKYHGVVCGWDRTCARDVQWATSLGVSPEQPFFEVLPDEDECQRLFGATRISKYVAQENVELVPSRRILHRALNNYFRGYSIELGRYIPSAMVQYVYPDVYAADDIEPVGDDSNILYARESPPGTQAAVRRKHMLVDVG